MPKSSCPSDPPLTILSIDPASHRMGWCVIHASHKSQQPKIRSHGVMHPAKDTESINGRGFYKVYQDLRRLLKEHPDISQCVIEGFAIFQRRTAIHIVPKVQAALQLAWFSVKKTECSFILPSHWRRELTGQNGSVSKRTCELYLIRNNYVSVGLTEDEYDAIGLGIVFIRRILSPSSKSHTRARVKKATKKVVRK